MKQVTTKYGRGLLPAYFKVIGIAVITLALIALFVLKPLFGDSIHENKELLKVIFLDFIILGLIFIAWTRDKVEDEMTVHLRFRAMGMAFIYAVVYVFVHPIITLLWLDGNLDLNGQQIIIATLIMFSFFYYTQKKRA